MERVVVLAFFLGKVERLVDSSHVSELSRSLKYVNILKSKIWYL